MNSDNIHRILIEAESQEKLNSISSQIASESLNERWGYHRYQDDLSFSAVGQKIKNAFVPEANVIAQKRLAKDDLKAAYKETKEKLKIDKEKASNKFDKKQAKINAKMDFKNKAKANYTGMHAAIEKERSDNVASAKGKGMYQNRKQDMEDARSVLAKKLKEEKIAKSLQKIKLNEGLGNSLKKAGSLVKNWAVSLRGRMTGSRASREINTGNYKEAKEKIKNAYDSFDQKKLDYEKEQAAARKVLSDGKHSIKQKMQIAKEKFNQTPAKAARADIKQDVKKIEEERRKNEVTTKGLNKSEIKSGMTRTRAEAEKEIESKAKVMSAALKAKIQNKDNSEKAIKKEIK